MTGRPVGFALWLVAAVVAVQGQTGSPRTERLTQGEQRTIRPGYAVGDIAIADPRVCDFRVLAERREILLVARGAGLTTLTLWDQRGAKRDEISIEVRSREYAKLLADLTELVKPFPDVTVKALGARLVLSGTVQTTAELETIRKLATIAGDVTSVVTLKSEGAPAGGSPVPPPPVPVEPPRLVTEPVVADPSNLPKDTDSVKLIEYTVEVYEVPVSAPPPEVMGPQGKRLHTVRLQASIGTPVQQFLLAKSPTGKEAPSDLSGIHITLIPGEVVGSEIRTRLVVTTNLPLGSFDQKGTPVWVRSELPLIGRAGVPTFVTERQLAMTAEPTVYVPWSAGGSKARAAAGVAMGAAATLPGGAYLPGLGGLFGGGGRQKMRPTVLVLVVTANSSHETPR